MDEYNYDKKVEDPLTFGNPRQAWWGIKTIQL